ncbi:unnamed protein product [Choristocarpus tenellus]
MSSLSAQTHSPSEYHPCLQAGFIMSCVGSVHSVVIRLAGAGRPTPAAVDEASGRVQSGCEASKGAETEVLIPSQVGVTKWKQEQCEEEKHILRMGASNRFEILSLVGTLSLDGCHLHMSLGDERGNVIGGHLIEAVVHTTAELVIGEPSAFAFSRKVDHRTGFKELHVANRDHCFQSGE